jgi:hypothetical protein
MIYKMPIGGEWRTWTDDDLAGFVAAGDEASAVGLMAEYEKYEQNRLSRFLPHGIKRHAKQVTYAGGRIKLPPSGYPKEYANDGVGFMNDRENDYVFMLAPRKTGKSYQGAAKVAVEVLDCDPTWPLFTENGVVHKPFEGPTTVVVASFSWSNVADLWKVYQELWPRDELGPYSPQWGKYPGEKGAQRQMSFGDGRPKSMVTAKSKVELVFLCYTQQQHFWESFKAKLLHADEQIKIPLLRAWEDGSSTMGDYTPCIFTLSGFVLKERPEDTGAGGPLKPLWDGRRNNAKTVGRYNLDVTSTPDEILSPKKKKERYDRYVNPAIERSKKDERRGLAVYFPGWEPGGGLVFGPDVWDREIHVINPLWADDKVPRDWTKWRVIDYADRKTTCCAWFAVGPEYMVLYRLLYEQDLLINDAVEKIIKMSHNERHQMGMEPDEATGGMFMAWREVQCGEEFYTTLIDSRAGAWRQNGTTVIELFERYGIEDISPASGKQNEDQIPNLKDLLRIDWTKDHPWRKGEDGKPTKGCPSLFVFDGVAEEAIEELEGMPADERPESRAVINKKFAHDFIDTAKYFASDNPQYYGDTSKNREEERDDYGDRDATPYTGY